MRSTFIGLMFTLFLTLPVTVFSQDAQEIYSSALRELKSNNYKDAAKLVDVLIEQKGFKLSKNALYNSACIYALNKEPNKSLNLLEHLVTKLFYSNTALLESDNDLDTIRDSSRWKNIITQANENARTAETRLITSINTELVRAKKLLNADDGKLWGTNLWHQNILIIGRNNKVFGFTKFPGSKSVGPGLYTNTVLPNTLSYTNTVQDYKGNRYATVTVDSLEDEGATIIHELFHRAQEMKIRLRGNPVEYLDNYDARLLLRLEYAALRNALKSIDSDAPSRLVRQYLDDAVLFRTKRQSRYQQFTREEVEIETSEGLANYTGLVLSEQENKYLEAIKEIDSRESAQTYTRPFPYATGPAYGLIFDHLGALWRGGLDELYDFRKIYEEKLLGKKVVVKESAIAAANERNSYQTIRDEELAKKRLFDTQTAFYKTMFFGKPTISVSLASREFSMSFNMNGTLVLKGVGLVYSGATGTSLNQSNFGSFTIDPEKAELGKTGVLRTTMNGITRYTFPLPIRTERNTLFGEFYRIELNEDWEVIETTTRGDLEIVRKNQ